MADVNAEIGVNIDTSNALAQIKSLQRQLSQFHTSVARSSETAALAQRDLQRNLLNSINSIGAFSAEFRTIKTTAESFTDSLEKNKFSMREYFRYAGASTRTFGKLFKSEFDTINKVAEENVKRLQTQYIKLGRDSRGVMKAIAVIPKELNMEDFSTKTQIAAQRQALFNQLVKQGSTNLLNFGKNTQWAGRQLMVGFTIPLTILGNTAAKTFMEMETAALKFRKVYGDLFTPKAETQQALADVEALGQMFTKYGIAVSQTVNLAAEAAAAGFQGLDLQRQVTEATRLQVLGQVDQQKALETTISLQNAFQMSSADLADSINFLNAVENQTVVSLDDITTAIPKAAPVVKQLGGNVKDLAFFMAAMKEGGINASEGANALKSGLASLINPTDKAREMMAGFGIDIDSIVNRNAGNVKQTVIEFAQALDNLSDLNRQRAIEQLFGKFQLARLSTLFENVTKSGNQASRVLDLATASTEDLAIMAESELGMTAESAMNKFRKSVEDLKFALVPVGQVFLETVTPIIESIGNILEKFNNLPRGVKKAITVLTVAIGAIGPVALMTFGLLANALANGIKFISILRNGYLRLTGQSQILGEQTNYLTIEQQNAAAVAHSLDQAHANLTQTFNAETRALAALTSAYQSALSAAQRFAVTNPNMMSPRTPKRYASGVVSVPGPRGAGDIVPAMLSPGEAVIPADMAKKYGGLIDGMIAGNIPGYQGGRRAAYWTQTKRNELLDALGLTEGQRARIPLQAIGSSYSVAGAMAPKDINRTTPLGMTKEYLQSPLGRAATMTNLEVGLEDLGLSSQRMAEVLDDISPQITKAIDDWDGSLQGWQKASRGAMNIIEESAKITAAEKDVIRKRFAPINPDDYTVGSNVVTEVSRRRATTRAERVDAQTAYGRDRQIAKLRARGFDVGSGFDFAHMPGYEKIPASSVKMAAPSVAGIALSAQQQQILAQEKIAFEKFRSQQDTARADAAAYQKTIEQNTQDIYVQSRDRGSPHPMASQDGRDDAIAYSNARDQELAARIKRAGGVGGPGGTGGGRGGGGPHFIGMPSMPERKPIRKTIGQRFSNAKGKFAAGRYAGASMGASMGVMAASMVPGKMGELASKMMPVIFGFQALQMILKFLPGPLKLFTIGLGVTIGIIKLLNAAKEREREKVEAFSDVLTQTKPEKDFLADYFNFIPIQGSLENFGKELEQTSIQVRTEREQLKQSEQFQKTYARTIRQVRGMSDKQAENALTFKGLELISQGMAREQVQLLIDSIKEEAGKADLKFDFKSLKFNEQGMKDLNNQFSNSLKEFNKTYQKGLNKVFSYQAVGEGRSATVELVEKIVPTKEAAAALKNAGALVASYSASINRLVKTGAINLEQFSKMSDDMFANIAKSAPDSITQINILNAALKAIDPALAKAAQGVDNLKDKQLLLKAAIAGVSAELIANLSIAIRTAAALNKVAEEANKGGKLDVGAIAAAALASDKVKGLKVDLLKEIANVIKLQKELNKVTNQTTTGEEKESYLTKQTRIIKNQIDAFKQLRIAGVDAATAIELSGNEETAALLKTADGVKKVIKQIQEYAALKKQLAKMEIAGAELGEFTKTTLEMQRAAFDLQEKLVEMKYSNILEKQNELLKKEEEALAKIEDKINDISRIDIRPIQDQIDANNRSLEEISFLEDEINEKYDKQEQTLSNIAEIQEEINSLQRGRMDVAEALSRGDIAAAASAMQELRAQQAGIQQNRNQRVLENARKAQIDALGRNKLEKENKKLQQEILKIQKDKVLELEKEKRTAEDTIDSIRRKIRETEFKIFVDTTEAHSKLSALFGMTKTQIDNAISALDLAKAAGIDINNPNLLHNILKAANGDAEAINDLLNKTPGLVLAAIAELVNLRENMNLPVVMNPKLKASLPIQVVDGSCPSGYAYYIVRYEDTGEGAKEVSREKVGCVPGGAVIVAPGGAPGGATGGGATGGGATGGGATGGGATGGGATGGGATGGATGNKATSGTTGGGIVGGLTPAGVNIADFIENTPVKKEYDKIVAESLLPGATPSDFGSRLAALDNKLVNLIDAKVEYDEIVVSSLKTGATPSDFAADLAAADRKLINAMGTAPKPKSTGSNTVPVSSRPFGGKSTTSTKTTTSSSWGPDAARAAYLYKASGGFIAPKYFARGNFARGTDIVPAMLTPGEFVVRKYAVDNFGVDKLKSINNGTYQDGSVYNYSVNVNVTSDADANDIANTVITKIKQLQGREIRRQLT